MCLKIKVFSFARVFLFIYLFQITLFLIQYISFYFFNFEISIDDMCLKFDVF